MLLPNAIECDTPIYHITDIQNGWAMGIVVVAMVLVYALYLLYTEIVQLKKDMDNEEFNED